MFRQTDQLPHSNSINNNIPMKTRPFQQTKNYGNRSTYSKLTAEQRFKKDFDVALLN